MSLYAPLPELGIEESIGEALPADSDAFKNSVAPQLMKDQVSIHHTRPLQLIGDDAAHKVGCGVACDNGKISESFNSIGAYCCLCPVMVECNLQP